MHWIEPEDGGACVFKRHPGRACSGTVATQCQYSPERQGSAAVARRETYIFHPVQTLARTQGSRLDQARDRPTLADDRAARRTEGGCPCYGTYRRVRNLGLARCQDRKAVGEGK